MPKRKGRFTFLVNPDERRLITSLANRLQRTESDAVRWVVIDFARALEIGQPATPITSSQAQPFSEAALHE